MCFRRFFRNSTSLPTNLNPSLMWPNHYNGDHDLFKLESTLYKEDLTLVFNLTDQMVIQKNKFLDMYLNSSPGDNDLNKPQSSSSRDAQHC